MKLCSYIVRSDAGLAPNPFWGHCSLAVCTPNHQGSRLSVGDWIAGFLSKARGYRFLYAMEISEILDLDAYYWDKRFEEKKPDLRGSWKERCGDNFYSRGPDGEWIQHRNRFHLSENLKKQDTKYARAFLARRYWYRGRKAEAVPGQYAPLIGGRGARVNHDPQLVSGFCAWVARQFETGVADVPNDNPDMQGYRDRDAPPTPLIVRIVQPAVRPLIDKK